ncbi:MAG TPA: class I tRNA ligase family protein [Acidimicrobiales bacterium]|nr:class I tRNA ligase family protein [Acidimicrobiales bacterium]
MALSDGATVGAALRVGGAHVPIIGSARVYVCGITPYDTTHLGHAATFVWTDVAARVLHLTGAHVDVCRNVTDVDDHLLAESRSRGVPWRSLATQQTYRFERDASDLGIIRPAFEPRSHDYVDDVIGLALGLIARDAAYERDGSVFFRGEHVCETAGLDPTEAVIRLEEDSAHHDNPLNEVSQSPLDVAIWQRSSGDEPAWPSPWGEGRPGWHAECAAMALSTFGPTVDLHGGGADLDFPHHAYEAALAEAFTGVSPFARSWMHVGTVKSRGQKMAKSTGNLVFVHDLLQRWPAAAIRYLILTRPWRADWEFEEDSLMEATAHLDDMWSRATNTVDSDSARRQVVAALLDDIDASHALAIAREAGGQVLTELIEFLGLRDTTTWY